MSRHLGVTASREGLTDMQFFRARSMLAGYDVLHHGDCLGGDAQLDVLARTQHLKTIAHPPSNPKLRAYCKSDEIREPKEYHARDKDIVDESERTIAFPHTSIPTLYSGTWYTIGYAQDTKKPLAIVFPNGDVSFERWEE